MKKKNIELTEYQVAMIAAVLQEAVNKKVFPQHDGLLFNYDGIAKAMLNDLSIALDANRRARKRKRGA